jgi:hypothetical protein
MAGNGGPLLFDEQPLILIPRLPIVHGDNRGSKQEGVFKRSLLRGRIGVHAGKLLAGKDTGLDSTLRAVIFAK